jgi:hypothetical protein
MGRHESLDTVLAREYPQMAASQEAIRESSCGGAWRWAVRLLGGHTHSKNPAPMLLSQTCIASPPATHSLAPERLLHRLGSEPSCRMPRVRSGRCVSSRIWRAVLQPYCNQPPTGYPRAHRTPSRP